MFFKRKTTGRGNCSWHNGDKTADFPSSPNLVHELDNDELQNLIEGGHAVNTGGEVLERQGLIGRRQHNKRIPLAGGILRGARMSMDTREKQHVER